MTGNSDYHDGGCACGLVRYRMTSEPLIVHGCHCSYCQRQTGTSFVVNALIESDRVIVLKGEVVEVTLPSPSGESQKIACCDVCKTTVWSNYLCVGEKVRFIRVGTLDNPTKLPPDVHIYTSTKQPWLPLPPNARAFEEYYETEETWSKDSLRRRDALRQSE